MEKIKQSVLISGTAGFIGSHLALKLVKDGFQVIGIDNINEYYDQNLKYDRLAEIGISKNKIKENKSVKSHKYDNYTFIKTDITDFFFLNQIFEQNNPDFVCHLAAQAGVRYSLENPQAYINSNLVGFANIIEASKKQKVKHFIYASSSSVYGLNSKLPYSTKQPTNHPISLYAATKKSNELLAHSYSHLFSLPTTGLRLFTVYGTWGRPDMAIFKFTKSIFNETPIDVYNYGEMMRDFTYVDNITDAISKIIVQNPPRGQEKWDTKNPLPDSSSAPYKIYNVGNSNPVKLIDFIHELESAIGKKAKLNLLPIQAGDVKDTFADISELKHNFLFEPIISISQGVEKFVNWYKKYYKI